MTRTKLLPLFVALAALLGLVGCATPVEVKQALVSLDQGYADNAKLMQQYHQLSEAFKTRHKLWTLYVKNRAQLDLALRWATTDPQSPGVPAGEYAEECVAILGPEVIKLVNASRLAGLPPRTGASPTAIQFQRGTNTIDALIQTLPALANAVTRHTAAEYDAVVKHDAKPFDDYDAKIAALRRLNDAIKRYLDIDVTVKPADIKEISDSIRTLADK